MDNSISGVESLEKENRNTLDITKLFFSLAITLSLVILMPALWDIK